MLIAATKILAAILGILVCLWLIYRGYRDWKYDEMTDFFPEVKYSGIPLGAVGILAIIMWLLESF